MTEWDPVAERLRTTVARAIRKVCPRWLIDEADDLTQIVTTRVLGRLQDPTAHVDPSPAYLYRAAYSALVDEIRTRRRRREVPIQPDLQTQSPVPNPEQRARAREIRDAILSCLAELQPSRRRATMLHIQGHSVAEISALLDCGRKKADNLIYRGLADLRACLTGRGVTP
jgi:RNA polymerase sigma-70 factor (ECF subfamily)